MSNVGSFKEFIFTKGVYLYSGSSLLLRSWEEFMFVHIGHCIYWMWKGMLECLVWPHACGRRTKRKGLIWFCFPLIISPVGFYKLYFPALAFDRFFSLYPLALSCFGFWPFFLVISPPTPPSPLRFCLLLLVCVPAPNVSLFQRVWC